jgi:hypothetical protein
MTPGIYTVEMWNGRVGILSKQNVDVPEYFDVDRKDLPAHLTELEVGESIKITMVPVWETLTRPPMPRRQQLLLELERERRKGYGAIR